MDFGSKSVLSKSSDFMDFGLPTANTRDKLKSVIIPTTTFGRLVDGSYWLPPRYDIEEVTTERVSEKKSYSDYILKNEFDTMEGIQYFERENISLTQPTVSPSKNGK